MRTTSAIGVRAVPAGRVRRSPGCGATVRGGTPHCRGLGATPRRIEVDLSPRAVEAVALRVAQLMRAEEAQRQPDLLTAGELARELRVERSWVYKHAHMLGGERIGDGPKAQWRFDLKTARAALARERAEQETGRGA